MWTKRKSLILTIVFILISLALLTALAGGLPFILQFLIDKGFKTPVSNTTLFAFFYSCVPFLYIVLIALLKMAFSTLRNKAFSASNIYALKIISWCSFTLGVISFIASIFVTMFSMLGIAMFFIGLIVRVFKNIMESALSDPEEKEKEEK